MNPSLPLRRRAEAFHASVDGLRDEPTDAGHAGRDADLLRLVAQLRSVPPVEPRPEFSADLRARLMTAAVEVLTPESPAEAAARRPVRRRTRRERQVAVLVGGFAVATATGSMAVAAQSALPGDTLYPLKRALENVQTSIQRNADDRGESLLGNAEGRLDELAELSRTDADAEETAAIIETLRDFTAQAGEASDLLLDSYARTGSEAPITELRDFAWSSMDALESLADVVPDEARASLDEAASLLSEIDRRAASACPSCAEAPALAASLPRAADVIPAGLLDHVIEPAESPDASASDRPDRPRRPDTGGSLGQGPAQTGPTPGVPSGTASPVVPDPSPSPVVPDPGPATGTTEQPTEADGTGTTGGANAGGGVPDPVDDLLEGRNGGGGGVGGLLEEAGGAVDDTVGGLTGGGSNGSGGGQGGSGGSGSAGSNSGGGLGGIVG